MILIYIVGYKGQWVTGDEAELRINYNIHMDYISDISMAQAIQERFRNE